MALCFNRKRQELVGKAMPGEEAAMEIRFTMKMAWL